MTPRIRPATVIATVTTIALAGLCSCKGIYNEPDGVIYSCDDFTVYTDSIVLPDTTFVPTRPTAAEPADSLLPRYASDQPVVDALFARDMAAIAAAATRPATELDVMLSLYCLAPHRAQQYLRSRIDGLAVATGSATSPQPWPVDAARAAWVPAAYDIYKATADTAWLHESYTIARNTLHADMQVLWDPDNKLMHGGSVYFGSDPKPYPAWMQPVDIYSTMGLGTNATYTAAFDAMAAMAETTGDDASLYRSMSQTISTALNNRLWIPNHGYYSQYIYGNAYHIQSQATDCLGQALAVLAGIANEEMSRSVVAKTPRLPCGTVQIYPRQAGAAIEVNPIVQAFWNLAAAKAKNMQALCHGLGALYRYAAFATDSCLTAAPTAAMAIRVFAGMEFSDEGIRFRPVVPAALTGTKTISGFRYRNAQLTVRIHGTGVTPIRFAIDSIEQPDRVFPIGMAGRHTIDITMANDRPSPQAASISAPETMPPVPRVKWNPDNRATIENFAPGTAYNVYLNGILEQQIITGGYSLYQAPQYTEVGLVPVHNETVTGYSMRPYGYAPEGSEYRIEATRMAHGGTMLIKDRKLAKEFVAMTIYRNRSLRFTFDAPEAGRYLISLRYANAGERCALRTLTVGTQAAGTFVMPIYGTGGWTGTTMSNTLRVDLDKGANTIGIDYPALPGNNGTILLRNVRIIKQ